MDASHLILSLTSEYVYVYVVHGETGAHREMKRAVRGLVLVSKDVVHLFWVWNCGLDVSRLGRGYARFFTYYFPLGIFRKIFIIFL